MAAAEVARRRAAVPGEELAEVGGLAEAQAAGDHGYGLVGVREQALRLERDAGVDEVLGWLPGRGRAGAGEGLDRAAQPPGIVLGAAAARIAALKLGPEPSVDLAAPPRVRLAARPGQPIDVQQQGRHLQPQDLRRDVAGPGELGADLAQKRGDRRVN